LNAVEDAFPAGAAAQIGREPFLDHIAIGCFVLLQHRRGTNKNAWNAEAALDGTLVNERLAQDTLHILWKPFESNDVCAFHLFRLAQAGQYRCTVDQDRAAAARSFRRTAVFGRNDPCFVA
jgi:hypothetical protein